MPSLDGMSMMDMGLACSVGWDTNFKTNRVVKYIRGWIETMYHSAAAAAEGAGAGAAA